MKAIYVYCMWKKGLMISTKTHNVFTCIAEIIVCHYGVVNGIKYRHTCLYMPYDSSKSYV